MNTPSGIDNPEAVYRSRECGSHVVSPRKARISQERWMDYATLWCKHCDTYHQYEFAYFGELDGGGDDKDEED